MRDLVLIGAGGHASVLAEMCQGSGFNIVAIVAPELASKSLLKLDVPHFTDDSAVTQFDVRQVHLINGIGAVPGSSLRRLVADKFEALGFEFASVVAPSALVSNNAVLAPGVQVFPSAIINAGAVIGSHSIINTGAIVEHDCQLDDHVHVATRAALCGGVVVGADSFIGPGAVVGLGICLGKGVTVGAGASVVRGLPNGAKYLPNKGSILNWEVL